MEDIPSKCRNVVLIGGGAGVPPMYGLCRELAGRGIKPTVILGFNEKKEVFMQMNLRSLELKL